MFAGDLLYRQIRDAGTVAATRLGSAAGQHHLTAYPFLKAASTAMPGQLLFYQPGSHQNHLATPIGLHGILPAPVHEKRWVGAVVPVNVTRGQLPPIRSSLRGDF